MKAEMVFWLLQQMRLYGQNFCCLTALRRFGTTQKALNYLYYS